MTDHTTDIPLKRCITCNERKLATAKNFTKDKRRKDGLCIYCKVCKTAYDAAYRVTHRDEIKARDAAHYAANQEEQKARAKAYRAANSDKVKAYNASWRALNPDKNRIKTSRRRSAQRNLPATFTADDWTHCLEYFGHCCAYCGRPRGLWHTLAQDHYTPLSRGGAYVPTNILPACHGDGGCNNSKWNRDPHEWLIRKFGARRAARIERRIQAYFDEVRKAASDES